MTPAELRLVLEARAEAMERDSAARCAEIYAQAGLIRAAVWSKHFISFEKAFPEMAEYGRKSGNKNNGMTDEAMLKQVEILNAALGGVSVGGC